MWVPLHNSTTLHIFS
jgi:hypothetical protein